jgi:hypothetical protein
MFLLLILNYCCSDGIIVEASDEFGYRVWCFHPVELVICILPDWQHLARLFYQHLGFFPVGSIQVLVCCCGIPSG